MSFSHIGVIGAGSWGTALALLLQSNALPVTLWGHDAGHLERLNAARENSLYLPGVALPETLKFTSNLDDLRGCDLVLLVTPSKAIREVASRLSTTQLRADAVLLNCTKGMERGSGLRMSQIVAECFPANP